MSFISAHYDRRRDKVLVWEKTEDGRRIKVEHPGRYYFYVPSATGDYEGVDGVKLTRLDFQDKEDFEAGLRDHRVRYESDLSPMEKVLTDKYFGKPVPKLTIGFVDIEVDYDPKIGFASPKNPYAPINAVTLYRSDLGDYVTIGLPPPGWAGTIPAHLPNTIIVKTERELLETFLDFLEEVDLLSGWNSEFFDLPYIGKRLELLFGERGLARLAFDGGPQPWWTEKLKFKHGTEKELTLELVSRVHLDYLRVFKKFNLGGRQSFSLAAIADDELDIPKLKYDKSLYELYREQFIDFLRYNRRDVEILVELNRTFRYIQLANEMVHNATVNFSAIFGSVMLIDTAIINYAHSELKQIVFDRSPLPEQRVEGALVLDPRVGLHRWVASCDLGSLYPNTYRTLNLSPEKIVGQLTSYEEGWRRVRQARLTQDPELLDQDIQLRLDGVDEVATMSVRDLITMLQEQKLALSAYGTVVDQNKIGLLPSVLGFWFNGRKEMQAKKKHHAALAEQLGPDHPEYAANVELEEFYDMLQGVRKVLLNSTYGATLNPFCRFHDPRIGASTTGSGRQITTHMIETVSKLVNDQDLRIVKRIETNKKGEVENSYSIACPVDQGPIYGDTDSCYFSISGLGIDDLPTDEERVSTAVAIADEVVTKVNASFSAFTESAFFCQPEFLGHIKANREIVAESGILRAKKKYVFFVRDMEGKRIDPNNAKKNLKTQGSDIKISSTPEVIRELLKNVTMHILKGGSKADLDEMVVSFRESISPDAHVNPLDFAAFMSVNNLDELYLKWSRIEKPGHGKVKLAANARGTINYNETLDRLGITDQPKITSGSKIKLIWLKDNEHGYTNMAFPSEFDELPAWFNQHFQVDTVATELKLVDQKLKNILDPIGWEVPTERSVRVKKLLTFD